MTYIGDPGLKKFSTISDSTVSYGSNGSDFTFKVACDFDNDRDLDVSDLGKIFVQRLSCLFALKMFNLRFAYERSKRD